MMRAIPTLLIPVAFATAQAPIPSVPLHLVPTVVPAAQEPSRAIDLVLCLDVSGSMDGLLNAARQNLWSIVNDMATLQPQPELRVALLTYGCPAYGEQTGFVAVQTPFTTDLDLVSQKLFSLTTNGGDEFVARVVRRALDELEWSADADALKLVFVAGNEAATQDPKFSAVETAAEAIGRGVLVNTIYCGQQNKPEADGWREVARRADGRFAAIEQDQQVVIETPFDEQLNDLSAKLNTTYVVYGQQGTAWSQNQVAQDSNAATLNPAASATRCVTKSCSLYFNPRFDLVDACKQPDFKLADIEAEDLPEDLRKLTTAQLQAHVDEKAKQRGVLQQQVAEIAKKREAFLAAERKKLGAEGKKMFERAMLDSVRAQAEARGFQRRVETPAPQQKQAPKQQVEVK